MLLYSFAAIGVAIAAEAAGSFNRFENLNADPHWDGYRNRLLPEPLPITRQNFGNCHYRNAPGIGGWVQRSLTPAWFAKPLPTRTLNDKLSASGKFAVTNDAGNSGLLFGWFNTSSRGWRTPNSLTFRIDGNGGKFWVFYEYGTCHWLTAAAGVSKENAIKRPRPNHLPPMAACTFGP